MAAWWSTAWMNRSRSGVGCSVGQRRRSELCRAGRRDPPELRTAHAAGGAERFDLRGWQSAGMSQIGRYRSWIFG